MANAGGFDVSGASDQQSEDQQGAQSVAQVIGGGGTQGIDALLEYAADFDAPDSAPLIGSNGPWAWLISNDSATLFAAPTGTVSVIAPDGSSPSSPLALLVDSQASLSSHRVGVRYPLMLPGIYFLTLTAIMPDGTILVVRQILLTS